MQEHFKGNILMQICSNFGRMLKGLNQNLCIFLMIGRKGYAKDFLEPSFWPYPRLYLAFALPFAIKNVQIMI